MLSAVGSALIQGTVLCKISTLRKYVNKIPKNCSNNRHRMDYATYFKLELLNINLKKMSSFTQAYPQK